MKLSMQLDYDLAEGWMAPWVAGLREGRAVASVCDACRQAHFAPVRFCLSCQGRASGWTELEGSGTVLFQTRGADGEFALVRFDGAANAVVARVASGAVGATSCTLLAVPDGPPALLISLKDAA